MEEEKLIVHKKILSQSDVRKKMISRFIKEIYYQDEKYKNIYRYMKPISSSKVVYSMFDDALIWSETEEGSRFWYEVQLIFILLFLQSKNFKPEYDKSVLKFANNLVTYYLSDELYGQKSSVTILIDKIKKIINKIKK